MEVAKASDNIRHWFIQYQKRRVLLDTFPPARWPFINNRKLFAEDTEILRKYLCMSGFAYLTTPINPN